MSHSEPNTHNTCTPHRIARGNCFHHHPAHDTLLAAHLALARQATARRPGALPLRARPTRRLPGPARRPPAASRASTSGEASPVQETGLTRQETGSTRHDEEPRGHGAPRLPSLLLVWSSPSEVKDAYRRMVIESLILIVSQHI